MCGRIISTLELMIIRKIANTKNVRQIKNIISGYNLGPLTIQAGIMHLSHYHPEEEKIEAEEAETQEISKTQEKSKNSENFDEIRLIHGLKWGITSFKPKTPSKNPICINIRIETLEFKFSKLTNKRCGIIVEGYYE